MENELCKECGKSWNSEYHISDVCVDGREEFEENTHEPPRDECKDGCKDCDYFNNNQCTYPLKSGGIA